MKLYILNKSFQRVAVIDQYSSLIWTKRYWDCGDFELYIPAEPALLKYLQKDYYVRREDCESTMIINRIEIKTDAENGNYFTISGKSAESILSYRVVANGGGFATNNASFMCNRLIMLEINRLEVKYADREIDIIKNIDYMSEYVDYLIWNTFERENLLTAVFSLCKQHGFSFKFVLTENKDGFDIHFYKGVDRTAGQTENASVIFSPIYYNLINSQYVLDASNDKTMAFIAGEGENDSKVLVWTHKTYDTTQEHNVPKQLDRREIFVDANNLKSKKDDGQAMSFDEYISLLRAKGKEKLFENEMIEGLSAEVDTTLQFVYKRDWDLGDIVSVENEYGMRASARIIEVIEVDDANGYRITPTFSEWEMI